MNLLPVFQLRLPVRVATFLDRALVSPNLNFTPKPKPNFFLKVAEAKVEFIKDDKGQVIKAILYQNGEHEMKKVK